MLNRNHPLVRFETHVLLMLLALATSAACADDPPVPPPKASGNQWSLVVLPDSQGYNQTYDLGGKFKGRGFQYKDRWPKQIEWIVKNRDLYNIRFAASVGDHVQNFGFAPAKADADPNSADAKRRQEWLNVVAGINLFHKDADPDKPALVPYALAIGNHDYHSSDRSSLDSREYKRFLGPRRFRDKDGQIKAGVDAWYKGDDLGWEYRKDGKVAATGAGRNSWQIFPGGGRTWLHLTLECGATDGGIAWAQEVIAANPGPPIILTTHAFIDGGGKLLSRDRMGRQVQGPNPTNEAQSIFAKLVKDEPRIFLILCGHMFFKKHIVMKNAKGGDVHVMEACFHLNVVGGRIDPAELPPTSPWKGEMDKDRNGSGWLGLIVFDPDAKKIRWFTYSPLIDVWAVDRSGADYKGSTFPVGEDVVEEFVVDFDDRFGATAKEGKPGE